MISAPLRRRIKDKELERLAGQYSYTLSRKDIEEFRELGKVKCMSNNFQSGRGALNKTGFVCSK